ncbi:MAG: HNH endonuclease [Bacteroidaceae bacterium]|nr:HNH endonuclease [Bacteroidaceae bacterium]
MTRFSFYRSREWQELRSALMLERVDSAGYVICAECGQPITKAYDCIAHHIKELTEQNVNDYAVSLNPENIALVHHRCHNLIHNRFGTYTRHIYIVWGSPCSGKQQYVQDNALNDDLIIDIDRIYSAVNNSRSNRVYDNVMQVYRQLIDMVKTRNGRWVNAWIIRGFPLQMDRERLASELGAELIHIDTDRETCDAVAASRGGEYPKFVADWWSKYRG